MTTETETLKDINRHIRDTHLYSSQKITGPACPVVMLLECGYGTKGELYTAAIIEVPESQAESIYDDENVGVDIQKLVKVCGCRHELGSRRADACLRRLESEVSNDTD